MAQAVQVQVEDAVEDGPILHTRAPPSSDYALMLQEVVRTGGKSYFAQVREIYALKFGAGKLAPIEYYHYGLYEDELSAAEKAAFVGHNLRAEVNRTRLDSTAFVVGTDKIAFYARAAELGLPTPATRALCHPERALPGAQHLRTPEALAAFLRDAAHYPFFAKPTSMSASVGSASVERYHAAADEVEMSDGRRFPVDVFVQEAGRYFARGWLIQERLSPHAGIAAIAGRTLSTLRMMVLDAGDGPQLIRSTWRVPVGEHGADVLWRGNMMADVDVETGTAVRALMGRGLHRQQLTAHPQTGATVVGATLPEWAEAKALALRAAQAFPELPLTGWDIAITTRGPVVIELEPDGGDPAVTQLASGRGLLSGPYGAWLKAKKRR
jgi:hypothetical protein